MRNAWLPVVTVIGLQVGGLLAGAVITETVFAWGGVGRYVVDGISNRDYFVIQSHDPGLRPDLPGREPPGGHPLRLPQPADPVRLMAAPADHDHGAVKERRASRGLWRDAVPAPAAQPAGASLGLVFIAVFVLARHLRPVPGALRAAGGQPRPTASSRRRREHIMGTDLQGRDEYSRILYGAQVSLVAGVASVVMGVCHRRRRSAPLAGGIGGRVDSVLMRVVDVLLAIPGILLAIGIVAWLGRGPAADHVRRRRDQRPDLRAHPARQPAVAARVGLRHGGAVARRVAARGCCSGTCCRTR